MADETLFATLFLFSFIVFWITRGYYVKKTRDPETPRSRQERREALKKEGWTGIALVLLTSVEIIIVIVYFLFPTVFSWTFINVPEIVRWTGLLIIIVSMFAVTWVHRTLGKAYSYALETKQDQKLVTSGPFSRVRHPLYSAHNIFNLGMVLLTMNIPLTIFAVIGLPITYTRMKDEERMMTERFGFEYEQYMTRTGRIFPKL